MRANFWGRHPRRVAGMAGRCSMPDPPRLHRPSQVSRDGAYREPHMGNDAKTWNAPRTLHEQCRIWERPAKQHGCGHIPCCETRVRKIPASCPVHEDASCGSHAPATLPLLGLCAGRAPQRSFRSADAAQHSFAGRGRRSRAIIAPKREIVTVKRPWLRLPMPTTLARLYQTPLRCRTRQLPLPPLPKAPLPRRKTRL